MTARRTLEEAHALGLEKSPLDRPRAHEASVSFPVPELITREEGQRMGGGGRAAQRLSPLWPCPAIQEAGRGKAPHSRRPESQFILDLIVLTGAVQVSAATAFAPSLVQFS